MPQDWREALDQLNRDRVARGRTPYPVPDMPSRNPAPAPPPQPKPQAPDDYSLTSLSGWKMMLGSLKDVVSGAASKATDWATTPIQGLKEGIENLPDEVVGGIVNASTGPLGPIGSLPGVQHTAKKFIAEQTSPAGLAMAATMPLEGAASKLVQGAASLPFAYKGAKTALAPTPDRTLSDLITGEQPQGPTWTDRGIGAAQALLGLAGAIPGASIAKKFLGEMFPAEEAAAPVVRDVMTAAEKERLLNLPGGVPRSFPSRADIGDMAVGARPNANPFSKLMAAEERGPSLPVEGGSRPFPPPARPLETQVPRVRAQNRVVDVIGPNDRQTPGTDIFGAQEPQLRQPSGVADVSNIPDDENPYLASIFGKTGEAGGADIVGARLPNKAGPLEFPAEGGQLTPPESQAQPTPWDEMVKRLRGGGDEEAAAGAGDVSDVSDLVDMPPAKELPVKDPLAFLKGQFEEPAAEAGTAAPEAAAPQKDPLDALQRIFGNPEDFAARDAAAAGEGQPTMFGNPEDFAAMRAAGEGGGGNVSELGNLEDLSGLEPAPGEAIGERGTGYRSDVLNAAGPGEPGLAVEAKPNGETHVVYRDPKGNPVANAIVKKGAVSDLAAAKDKGLLAGRAVKAIHGKLEEMGAARPEGAVTPDTQRLLERLGKTSSGAPAAAEEAPFAFGGAEPGTPSPRVPGPIQALFERLYPKWQAARAAAAEAGASPEDVINAPGKPAGWHGFESAEDLAQHLRYGSEEPASMMKSERRLLEDPEVADWLSKKGPESPEGGFGGAALAAHIAGGVGGGAYGATKKDLIPGHPTLSRILGGAAGAAAGLTGANLLSRWGEGSLTNFGTEEGAAAGPAVSKALREMSPEAGYIGEPGTPSARPVEAIKSGLDKLNSYRINAMLSGLSSAKNLVGNVGAAGAHDLELALSKVLGRSKGIEGFALPKVLSPQTVSDLVSEFRNAASVSEKFGAPGPGLTNKIITLPTRALEATDLAVSDAMRRANIGEDDIRDILFRGRPKSAVGQGIVDIATKHGPIPKIFMPFPRIGVNIMERGIERTPLLGSVAEAMTGGKMSTSLEKQLMGAAVTGGALAYGKDLPNLLKPILAPYAMPVAVARATQDMIKKGKSPTEATVAAARALAESSGVPNVIDAANPFKLASQLIPAAVSMWTDPTKYDTSVKRGPLAPLLARIPYLNEMTLRHKPVSRSRDTARSRSR